MNQVLLKPQQLTPNQYRDMKDNRPAGAGALKKIFFQCALREYNPEHNGCLWWIWREKNWTHG